MRRSRPTVKRLPQAKSTSPGLKPVALVKAIRQQPWTEETATLGPPTAQQTSRRACLVVLAGPEEGALHKLKANTDVTIGRGEDANIRINDDGVSRIHAKVTVRGDSVVVEDMGSRNGTYVGEDRIKLHVLQPEELIRVGATSVLKFCYIDTLEESYRNRLLDAALRDSLTGIYNRRHFDERLAHECAAARRHRRPLALLLIDIDNFKAVNDAFGHPTGDAVLRGVAQTLKDGLRCEDLPFRYGGEEFAVLLRETELPGALRLAERLRRSVERSAYPSIERTDPPLKVTVSIGVATFGTALDDRKLVEDADAGLYEAKRAGKNRVVHI